MQEPKLLNIQLSQRDIHNLTQFFKGVTLSGADADIFVELKNRIINQAASEAKKETIDKEVVTDVK